MKSERERGIMWIYAEHVAGNMTCRLKPQCSAKALLVRER